MHSQETRFASPPLLPDGLLGEIDRGGFAHVPDVVPTELFAALEAELETASRPSTRLGPRGGRRNVLEDVPSIQALARSTGVRRLAEGVLGAGCFAVRALLFDKTARANWKVRWHQDLSIALQEQREVAGFGPWSVKEGVVHAHAPASLLGRMLAIGLHLDDCGEQNGPLRVLPGTHLAGRLTPELVEGLKAERTAVSCLARRGDALAMRPLLLHASSPASRPGHRRVVQLEFAAESLPEGLAWRWRG